MASKAASSKPAAAGDGSAKSKPAYALTTLSARPHLLHPGDRIDEAFSPEVVADCVERGDAAYTKPEE